MGKSSPPPPDYGPLAQASKESAQIMARLGREQLNFARQQYNETAPLLEGIAQQQMAAQDQQMNQAQDYYDYLQTTYRPLERSIVQDAEDFDTAAYRERLARQAAADSGLAFRRAQQANERSMASMGVNPASGRFAGMQNATGLSQAASRASVMTSARERADQMGYARKLDAAGLGRNLPGASTAAYGGATAAGSAAGQSAQSAGQNYMGNMAVGASTIQGGLNTQVQGLSNVLNAQTSAYVNSNDSFLGDVGGILGGLGGIAKAGGFAALSDRRFKENVEEVAVDGRTGLTLYEFNYAGQPGKRYRGVMADEVEMLYPEAVVDRDGVKSVRYDLLGIELKEVS